MTDHIEKRVIALLEKIEWSSSRKQPDGQLFQACPCCHATPCFSFNGVVDDPDPHLFGCELEALIELLKSRA